MQVLQFITIPLQNGEGEPCRQGCEFFHNAVNSGKLAFVCQTGVCSNCWPRLFKGWITPSTGEINCYSTDKHLQNQLSYPMDNDLSTG